MAIYHFSAKIISRAAGSSALAAAAYRSASRLHDQRLDRSHDFSNKAGVIHSEVMLPDGAPEHLSDRERLWNAAEAAELRKDAQLAREIEFAIPKELSPEMGIDLARDFVRREFVERGMVADLNVHWDVGADGVPKPHAHVMLSMREVGAEGFGAKVRDWNRTELLQHWREAWADHVNERLAALDIDARIDHRSLEAQGIDLEPQHKIGPAASRMAADGLPLERVDEHREIARRNGEKLLANPRDARQNQPSWEEYEAWKQLRGLWGQAATLSLEHLIALGVLERSYSFKREHGGGYVSGLSGDDVLSAVEGSFSLGVELLATETGMSLHRAIAPITSPGQ